MRFSVTHLLSTFAELHSHCPSSPPHNTNRRRHAPSYLPFNLSSQPLALGTRTGCHRDTPVSPVSIRMLPDRALRAARSSPLRALALSLVRTSRHPAARGNDTPTHLPLSPLASLVTVSLRLLRLRGQLCLRLQHLLHLLLQLRVELLLLLERSGHVGDLLRINGHCVCEGVTTEERVRR